MSCGKKIYIFRKVSKNQYFDSNFMIFTEKKTFLHLLGGQMFILVNPLPLQECHINIVNWIYKYISILKLYAQKYSIEFKKKTTNI